MKPPETISANTWSEQEALESRKEAAPLTPCSPAQTCDSEPRVGNTTKDSRDSTTRRSVGRPNTCCVLRLSVLKLLSFLLGASARFPPKGVARSGAALQHQRGPEGVSAPSHGHNLHCSTINPSLLYYFQIIFKWVKSLWGIKALLNLPTLQWPLRYLVRVGMAEA